MRSVLITGAYGFVGKNLRLRLGERSDIVVHLAGRDTSANQLAALVADADFIFHLAGENRPTEPMGFDQGNRLFSEKLCALVEIGQRVPTIIFASSIQAVLENLYGQSKLAAESAITRLAHEGKCSAVIYRLPNVFGKWAKPNYNSAVATFCNNIARDLPIQIHSESTPLRLVYIDDVVETFISHLDSGPIPGVSRLSVEPEYATTVGAVASVIRAFRDSRDTLISENVGHGLQRALYATYVSYLPTERFAYPVKTYSDPRGTFAEMLKTRDAGQFSFFTAHPGVTRGGHYHHSKTEKFLVIRGEALFKFRHMDSGEYFELTTSGDTAQVVETVPGWTHDITNIGANELVVMLWANEIFDRARPDTYACPL